MKGVYAISADTKVFHNGKSSVSIRCDTCSTTRVPDDTPEAATAFGSVIQAVRADEFRGKRIAFTAYLKTADVQGDGAGLWVRVDGPGISPLAFDNMSEPDRLVRGTTDWKQYSVVVDVPKDAQVIALGTLLTGKGQVWIDDADLQTVDAKTPETGKKMTADMQKELEKLTPEQRAEAEKDMAQEGERAKSYSTQLENLGFEE